MMVVVVCVCGWEGVISADHPLLVNKGLATCYYLAPSGYNSMIATKIA